MTRVVDKVWGKQVPMVWATGAMTAQAKQKMAVQVKWTMIVLATSAADEGVGNRGQQGCRQHKCR